MPSVILGWVPEVTRVPSKMLVLDPPAYSELEAAELLDSLGEGKLSEACCDLCQFLLVAAVHRDSKLGVILLNCSFCEVALIC